MFRSTVDEWQKIGCEIGPAWVGLLLVAGVALAARFLHGLIPGPFLNKAISEVLMAVLLGVYIRNWVGFEARCKPGVSFALQRVLRLGIILLGLRLSLQDVASTGLTALILVGMCISVALLLAFLAGRLFRIPARLAALIGVGTAICGNSAIVATAPVIEAKEEEVSFAVATITFYGLLAVLLYPLIGHLAQFSDHTFGLWVGTAVNDTSQVVATGAAFSSAALNIATVVKLTRNTLMAPIIVALGLYYRYALHQKTGAAAQEASRLSLGKLFPGFVLGFLLMSLLRTVGVAGGWLPQDLAAPGDLQFAASLLKGLDEVAKFAILLALAAVGLNTDLPSMRRIGMKPLLAGACVALALALTSLALIMFSPLGL